MSASSLDPLILDLVEWVACAPRSYADVMDAWRTSCPRLTVWEDAQERGFLARGSGNARDAMVTVTREGMAFLRSNGRRAVAAISAQVQAA